MPAGARLFERAAALKARFDAAGLPRIESVSHIVPLHIGEAALCTDVSQRLLQRVRHVCNADQLPHRAARRGTPAVHPGPLHTDAMMDELVDGADRHHPVGSGARRLERVGALCTWLSAGLARRRRRRHPPLPVAGPGPRATTTVWAAP